MNERRFWFVINKGKLDYVQDLVTGKKISVTELEDLLNEQKEILLNKKETAVEVLIDLLNEQKTIIEVLNDEWIESNERHRKIEMEYHERVMNYQKQIKEQQATTNKLWKILDVAEDMIETRLTEHYVKQYKNLKQSVIDDE